MKKLEFVLAAMIASAAAFAGLSAVAGPAEKRRVFLNYDETHFVHSRTQAGIDPDENHIRNFVRQYRGTDVTDILFEIGSSQSSAVPSKTKESSLDMYHKTRENGQDVCFTNNIYARAAHTFYEVRKIDPVALWIEEARKAGIRPWLSFRMNDCHGNAAPTGHPEFFHEHADCRRIRHREPIDYFDRCYDYSCALIRNRELDYFGEMLERYRPDGIEIDWQREIYCFRPGREDASVMTAFMRTVRKLANEAAKRCGHPVQVLARVPSDPTTALRYGFDAAAWVDEGLVDVLVPCPRWYTNDNNLPVDIWKTYLRGAKVVLAPGLETRVIDQAGRGFLTTTGQVLGTAAAFYGAGADAIYLFNYFDDPAWQDPERRYWKAKGGAFHYPFPQPQETLALAWPNQMKWLREIGDPAKVYAAPRLNMLTWRDIVPLGERGGAPFPTKVEKNGLKFFRLETGPVDPGRRAFVRLGVPGGKAPKRVFVNSRPCAYVGNEACVPAFTASPLAVYEMKGYAERTAIVEVIGEDADLALDHLDIDIRDIAVRPAQWVNVGSNTGLFGYDWKGAGVDGLNLAGSPQSMRRSIAKLKEHRAEIADGAYVIIPLCLFTSVVPDAYNARPSRTTHPLLAFDGTPSQEVLTSSRDNLVRGWKKEFSIRNLDDPMTETNRASYAQMVVFARESVAWCRAEKLVPVFVFTPASKCLGEVFSDRFFKAYVLDFVRDIGGDVAFLNYWKDPAFADDALFANALFLNRTGTKKLTARTMDDVRRR